LMIHGMSEVAAIHQVDSWLKIGAVGKKEREAREMRRGRRK